MLSDAFMKAKVVLKKKKKNWERVEYSAATGKAVFLSQQKAWA